MPKIRIIDNHLIYRQMPADSLKADISSSVIGLAASRTDLIDPFRPFSPDIVFFDVRSTGTVCFRLTEKLKTHHLALRDIRFTGHDEPEYLRRAGASVADDCLSKNSISPEGMINIIFIERHADRDGIIKQEDRALNRTRSRKGSHARGTLFARYRVKKNSEMRTPTDKNKLYAECTEMSASFILHPQEG